MYFKDAEYWYHDHITSMNNEELSVKLHIDTSIWQH
jgi:hypothetical protein